MGEGNWSCSSGRGIGACGQKCYSVQFMYMGCQHHWTKVKCPLLVYGQYFKNLKLLVIFFLVLNVFTEAF